MFSMENSDVDSNNSMNVSNINDLLEPLIPMPSIAATDCDSSFSETRLHLLDGTYFKYLAEESMGKQITAVCMKCPRDVITKVRGYHNCTSNFLGHLKRKHGNKCIEEYKAYAKKVKADLKRRYISANVVKTNTSTIRKSNEKKVSQKQFDENILNYFIHHMIPVSEIEDPYFSKIFTDLEIAEKGLALMSPNALERGIDKEYQIHAAKIKSDLSEADYLCTTTHIWSSEKESVIGTAAHWITTDLRRSSVALACQRLPKTNSYGRLSNIIKDFDIEAKKIVSSMTSNGINFVKAFNKFGVELNNIDRVKEVVPHTYLDRAAVFGFDDEEYHLSNSLESAESHLRCYAHTLILCLTTDVIKLLSERESPLYEIHSATMKKCNVLWKAAQQPESSEIMQKVLKCTLSRPDQCCWNSFYVALQQIYNIKDKNLHLHRALNIQNYIAEHEFEYIKEYMTCTEPLAKALDIIQSETTEYYGIILPYVLTVRKKLLSIEQENNFAFCKPLINIYRNSVERRFEKMFYVNTLEAEEAAMAALSYPRFKNKWLTCLELTDRTKILEAFKTRISKGVNNSRTETVPPKKCTRENTFFKFEFDSDSDSDMSVAEISRKSANTPAAKAELLMLQYFAEESYDLQLLNRYPAIKSIFIKYNTPLPSSSAGERVFSFATMTNLQNSHKLSDNMFEKIVVLKLNLNYHNKL